MNPSPALRYFHYNRTCEIYDNWKYENKKLKVQVQKRFFINEEVIDYFHHKLYITIIDKFILTFSFNITLFIWIILKRFYKMEILIHN